MNLGLDLVHGLLGLAAGGGFRALDALLGNFGSGLAGFYRN
jgi:hypothetical protein